MGAIKTGNQRHLLLIRHPDGSYILTELSALATFLSLPLQGVWALIKKRNHDIHTVIVSDVERKHSSGCDEKSTGLLVASREKSGNSDVCTSDYYFAA